MKKMFLGVVAVGIALILSGCGKQAIPDQNSGSSQNSSSAVSSAITSIKDALKLGGKTECVYTTKINGEEIKAIMQTDGKNFKSTSEINGRKMYSIMKDDVSYTWGEGIPVASKLSMSCIKDLPKPEGQEANSQIEDMQNPEKVFDGATNVVCNPVASVDISVPENVQFQDMCEMMKGMINMTKNIPNIPNMPNIPNLPAQ
jgi:hypothetical protein